MNRVEDAKDIASETFCRAFLCLKQYEFRQPNSIHPWLRRIALNLIADRARALPPGGIVSLDAEAEDGTYPLREHLADENPGPEDILERKEMCRLVRAALADLPPGQHEVVIHRFLNGLSIRETARLVDRSEGATKSLIRRAILSLRRSVLQRLQGVKN